MWRWRRTEKFSWTDRVKNEEVLQRVKEDRNILHTINEGRIAGFVTYEYCVRNAEGQLEGTRRRERRRMQVPDNFKGKMGCWNLTEETLRSTECSKVTVKTQKQCINVSILLWRHVSVLLDHLQGSSQRYEVQSVHIMI
jgi:hypothetical protein